jgi:hypothetical protein
MINKIGDVSIRETQFEETTEAKEQQPQDHIGSEVEPIVQATPEYKSGLIAERRMESQAQELLLRNQLNEPDKSAAAENETRHPVSFTRDSAPRATPKSPSQVVKDTIQHIPDELNRQVGEIGKAWSDPGKTLGNAIDEAGRLWSDIKNGK